MFDLFMLRWHYGGLWPYVFYQKVPEVIRRTLIIGQMILVTWFSASPLASNNKHQKWNGNYQKDGILTGAKCQLRFYANGITLALSIILHYLLVQPSSPFNLPVYTPQLNKMPCPSHTQQEIFTCNPLDPSA